MIRIYGMPACPDCTYLDDQIEGNENFVKVDISTATANLKAFLKLRDQQPVFDAVRSAGGIGIPCFELEDGRVTLVPEEVGLRSRPGEDAPCCSPEGGC